MRSDQGALNQDREHHQKLCAGGEATARKRAKPKQEPGVMGSPSDNLAGLAAAHTPHSRKNRAWPHPAVFQNKETRIPR
jgi:hypothetical protein